MKILQTNLNRCRAAHDLAYARAIKDNFDVLVVAEPNLNKTRLGWFRDKRNDVAIFICNKNIELNSVIPNEGFIHLILKDFNLFCAYFSPNAPIRTYEEKMDILFESIRSTQGKILLIGDLNAKAHEWGSPTVNERGRILCEHLNGNNMIIHNDGLTPTCVRPNGQSFVDVTTSTADIAPQIKNWRVSLEENLTDHRYIEFIVEDTTKQNTTERRKPDINIAKCRRHLINKTVRMNIQATPEACEDLLKEVIRETFKKANGPPRKIPYWWTESIEEAREECAAKRRALTRSRRRGYQHDVDDQERQDEYKKAKKKVKLEINKSKKAHWRKLCEALENDVWGDGYRIVMKEIKGMSPVYNLTKERTTEIVHLLFPRRREVWDEEDDQTDLPPPFTLSEIGKAVSGLKKGKAPGPDGVPAEVIKVLWEVAQGYLMELMNTTLARSEFPANWKIAKLVLIPKSNKNVLAAYRPISLINTTAKLYETLIRDRLNEEIEQNHVLSDRQYGFRKKRSTLDAVKSVLDVVKDSVETWCLFIAIDVKNAFNEASWARIIESLREKHISPYIIKIISNYLRDRKVKTGHGDFNMNAGVPQGSVLGPTLWNIMYDGILDTEKPRGSEFFAYADDLGIIVKGNNVSCVNDIARQTLHVVDAWLTENNLAMAPEKTQAIVLKGPRKRDAIDIQFRGKQVHLEKAVKYLGIWLDARISFGEHIKKTVEKAERRTVTLARILPNIGGPSVEKRMVLSGVTHSVLLYGAPIWKNALRIKKYRQMLIASQRKILLRVARAYRTVSAMALQVITGTPPIDLLVEERVTLQRMAAEERTDAARKQKRNEIVEKWQEIWDQNNEVAVWTKTLIPDIKTWLNCPHRGSDYFMTQFLTGHGSFSKYTFRIGKKATDLCVYCEGVDSPEHTVLYCERWEEFRRELKKEIIAPINPENLMSEMTRSPRIWKIAYHMITTIMANKEREERDVQRT